MCNLVHFFTRQTYKPASPPTLLQSLYYTECSKAIQEDSNCQSYFTGEAWQEGNTDGVICEDAETDSLCFYTSARLGLKPIKNVSCIEEKAESSVAAAASSFLDTGPQNAYKLTEYVETNYNLIDAETDTPVVIQILVWD